MIILASQSPRRRELIKQITDDFICVVSDAQEISEGGSPEQIAAVNARLKAKTVHDKTGGTVVGADTVVALNGVLYGKPRNKAEAKKFLKALNGKKHTVVTAVCVIGRGCESAGFEKTVVEFNKLSDAELNEYIRIHKPLDKAGAYGAQDGFGLIKHIEGNSDNVIGLPVELTRELIKKCY